MKNQKQCDTQLFVENDCKKSILSVANVADLSICTICVMSVENVCAS